MKQVESYQPCENCGKHLYAESPPPPRAYERGEIHLCGGSMILLPDEVVKARHVDGVADGHAENVDGHYCDIECLTEHIRTILRKKSPPRKR